MTSDPSPPPASRPKHFLLRRGEQLAAATLTAAALVGLLVAWLIGGGHRGELIEIDRADPNEIQFVVDVNSADWPELTLLPDIGETMAKRIVQSRQTDGPFVDLDDIQRVRGIGPKTLEKMRPYLLPMADDAAIVGEGVETPDDAAS